MLVKFSKLKKLKHAENLESPKIEELKEPITPYRRSSLLQMYSTKNKLGLRPERIPSAHNLYGSINKVNSNGDNKDGGELGILDQKE